MQLCALGVASGAALLTLSSCGGSTHAGDLPPSFGLSGNRLRLVLTSVRGVVKTESTGPLSNAVIVASRRQSAIQVINRGSRVNTNQAVYVVALHGHFADRFASSPAARKPPTGDTVILVIDRSTLRMTDFGIGNAINTQPLGRAYPLPVD
jgi:hypothetical protein